MLADEPTGQLDPDTTEQVLELLFDLQDAADTALVTISHDRQLGSRFRDVVHLRNGRICSRTRPNPVEPA